MCVVAIIGSGPTDYIPNLVSYQDEVDIWIGADHGALTLIDKGIPVHYAVGDFDSVTAKQKETIIDHAIDSDTYSQLKDETDLEIALQKAFEVKAKKIYLFGMTGGRLDHALINVQLLYTILNKNIQGIIIDQWNQVELMKPGTYTVFKNESYTYTSFIPFTESVKGISLTGFTYPLSKYDINWGSTRLISNELAANTASFSFEEGLLLFIQSRD